MRVALARFPTIISRHPRFNVNRRNVLVIILLYAEWFNPWFLGNRYRARNAVLYIITDMENCNQNRENEGSDRVVRVLVLLDAAFNPPTDLLLRTGNHTDLCSCRLRMLILSPGWIHNHRPDHQHYHTYSDLPPTPRLP